MDTRWKVKILSRNELPTDYLNREAGFHIVIQELESGTQIVFSAMAILQKTRPLLQKTGINIGSSYNYEGFTAANTSSNIEDVVSKLPDTDYDIIR